MRGKWILSAGWVLLISLGLDAAPAVSLEHEREKKCKRMSKEQLRVALEVLAKNQAKLMSIPGVVGVGIGSTKKGNRPAIHVFVNVEATGGTIPAAIPKQVENVPVRVIETDEIKAQ
jgi:hypothetical protein